MRYTIFLLAIFLIGSCHTVLDIDPHFEKENLVVSGLFTPDSLWTIRLGRSAKVAGYVDPQVLQVTDARVIIMGDDGFSDTLRHIGSGMYQTAYGYRPQETVGYTLDVEALGLPMVEASSHAPSALVEITRLAPHTISDTLDDPRYVLHFQLTDPVGSNHYEIELLQLLPYVTSFPNDMSAASDSVNPQYIPFQSLHPDFRQDYGEYELLLGIESHEFYGWAVFSDERFQNETAEFEIIFKPEVRSGMEMKFIFILSARSAEYAMLYDSLIYTHNLGYLDPGFDTFFYQEPSLSAYSNIKSGLGIFAGYSTRVLNFDLEGIIQSEM